MQDIKKDSRYIEMCQLYINYKNGIEIVDPATIYQLSIAFQYCDYHGGHHHQDCIYFDSMNLNVFHVDGKCGYAHADKVERIDEKFSQNILFNKDVLVTDENVPPESITKGYSFRKGTSPYLWYFCNKCVDVEKIKSEISLPNWTRNLVEKYSYIWIDWNFNKLG